MHDMTYDLTGKRVWVAGHRGMVGAALMRRLREEDCDVVTVPRVEVDFRRQSDVERWLSKTKPHAIFVAAARVGGIYANDHRPAEFIYDNLAIESNIIEGARRAGVEKLLFLGSSCIYPRLAPQPIKEEALLGGPLESTNQWYAIAKIAGIKLCQAYRRQYGVDFISAMPTNLYGPGDNFDAMSSHVVPALIGKAHRAKLEDRSEFIVWGTGTPRRDLLHVDDAADAIVHLMRHYSDEVHINVGSGSDLTIGELARLVCDVVGYRGAIEFDASKPDGTPRKLLDVNRLAQLGWRAQITLKDGLIDTYRWFTRHRATRDALETAHI